MGISSTCRSAVLAPWPAALLLVGEAGFDLIALTRITPPGHP